MNRGGNRGHPGQVGESPEFVSTDKLLTFVALLKARELFLRKWQTEINNYGYLILRIRFENLGARGCCKKTSTCWSVVKAVQLSCVERGRNGKSECYVKNASSEKLNLHNALRRFSSALSFI